MADFTEMDDEQFLKSAIAAARDGKTEYAFAQAKQIGPTSPIFLEAFQLRLGLCLEDLRNLQRGRFPELLELLQIVAQNPELLKARGTIEKFFEDSLEEPFARAVLGSLLFTFGAQRIRGFMRILENGKSLRQDYYELREAIDEAAFERFMDRALQSFPGKRLVGSGELSSEARVLTKPSYVRHLLEILENEEGVEDLNEAELEQTRLGILQLLALVCKHLGEPSSDFLGLHFLIQYFAKLGKSQNARDMAETGLLVLRNTQPGFSTFRTSLAWFCFAEAFNRSANPLAAARCYVFAVVSGKDEVPTIEWLHRNLRLAYQICRNLHLLDPASEFLKLRRELVRLTVKEPSVEFRQQLDAEELSLALFKANETTSGHIQVLERAIELLKKEVKKEEHSIVATACNAIRILKRLRHPIPEDSLRDIQERLASFPESLRLPFEAMINEDLSARHIRAMLSDVFPANHAVDLASAVTIMLPASLNALEGACERNDPDTFFVINNILSQPSLSEAVNPAENGSSQSTEWRRLLESGESDPNKLSDAYLNSNYERISKVSFGDVRDATISGCQRIMIAKELVLQVCADEELNLYQMVLDKEAVDAPEKLGHDIWSPAMYREWRKKYPVRYSDWQPPEPFRSEEVLENEVIDSLKALSIKSLPAGKSVTIIPASGLFGFPFNMAMDCRTELLLKQSSVTIAPSVPWLIKARSNPRTGQPLSKAWLGANTTPDMALQWLRSKLTDTLNSFDVEIVNELRNAELCEVELAIVASHGGTGLGGYFNSVDDRVLEIPPAQFAARFRGTGCVVLFVCSAGVAHQQFMTAEALGLAASLLRAGVRCVVGCPWPLPLDLPVLWMKPFLSAFNSGKTVADAAFEAAATVRMIHPNPCAWAAFHVYGDGLFSRSINLAPGPN